MAGIGVEEDQRDVSGLVLDDDAIGRLRLARWRGAMLADPGGEGRDVADRRIGDRRARPPVDGAARQVEHQVDHARGLRFAAEETVENLAELRPDAGERRHGGEERIENRGAQNVSRNCQEREDRGGSAADSAGLRRYITCISRLRDGAGSFAIAPSPTVFSPEVLMSGSTRSSADLDPRRRKILFRAWHRGMREMDLIMGRFADDAIAGFDDAELDAFERLIEVLDRDLLSWVTGEAPVPSNYDTELFRKLKAFHQHDKPIHV